VAACPDGRCDGSGFLYDEATRKARDCTCRPRRIARRKARKLAGVIPRRYQGVSFDRSPVTLIEPTVVRVVRAYVDALDENLREGRGIWFQGDIGTGKTTLAMLISATALREGHSVAIYSLPRLLGLLRESFDEGSEATLSMLLERLAAVELLHVDDLGAEQSSPWVLEQLYTIVNTRYEDGKAILLTTNLVTKDGDDALREQIGERTVSRIYEICGDAKPMFGPDRRLEAGFLRPEPALAWDDEPPAYGEPRRRHAS
jgi:DNA replication protein DnaC